MNEGNAWVNERINHRLTDWWNNQPKAVFHGFRENRALATVSGTFFRHCQIEVRTWNIDPRLWQPWSHDTIDTYKNTVIPSLPLFTRKFTRFRIITALYFSTCQLLLLALWLTYVDMMMQKLTMKSEVSLRTKLSFGWYLWVLENARMTSALRCNVYMLSRMKAQSCNLFLRCIRTTCKASAYLCLEI